ncbi:hypothetical protein GOZ80_18645 [Agrobacterium vitis]|uniref:Uncharacterized protein n=1 Tax=Agrobacterium vitis TaxID=373 RepID=A0A120DCR5_AGRVI|nr:hypothetical protein [Agrobacterium vitis]KAA3506227.1 hypothetical protein DXM22_24480 [Agrobacterium vitis]KAA3520656.1 hypothetical protein DXT89_25475 [Agrobacterium vitis]MBF2712964.1 hypothetical protein [Agrobacterium vitis]MCF1480156.1 hypothetical protein [Agrobacterium vitis]MUO98009.1 hypothetical protein [Agrobacterium vitis]
MTTRETTPEAIPAETDDARSIDSPAADNHRNDLAKAAGKGLQRAMKETDRTSDSDTPTTEECQQHGKR